MTMLKQNYLSRCLECRCTRWHIPYARYSVTWFIVWLQVVCTLMLFCAYSSLLAEGLLVRFSGSVYAGITEHEMKAGGLTLEINAAVPIFPEEPQRLQSVVHDVVSNYLLLLNNKGDVLINSAFGAFSNAHSDVLDMKETSTIDEMAEEDELKSEDKVDHFTDVHSTDHVAKTDMYNVSSVNDENDLSEEEVDYNRTYENKSNSSKRNNSRKAEEYQHELDAFQTALRFSLERSEIRVSNGGRHLFIKFAPINYTISTHVNIMLVPCIPFGIIEKIDTSERHSNPYKCLAGDFILVSHNTVARVDEERWSSLYTSGNKSNETNYNKFSNNSNNNSNMLTEVLTETDYMLSDEIHKNKSNILHNTFINDNSNSGANRSNDTMTFMHHSPLFVTGQPIEIPLRGVATTFINQFNVKHYLRIMEGTSCMHTRGAMVRGSTWDAHHHRYHFTPNRGGPQTVCYTPFPYAQSLLRIQIMPSYVVVGPEGLSTDPPQVRAEVEFTGTIYGTNLTQYDTAVITDELCTDFASQNVLFIDLAFSGNSRASFAGSFHRRGIYHICYHHVLSPVFVRVSTLLVEQGRDVVINNDTAHVLIDQNVKLTQSASVTRLKVQGKGDLDLKRRSLNISYLIWSGGTIRGKGMLNCTGVSKITTQGYETRQISIPINNYGEMTIDVQRLAFDREGVIHNYGNLTLAIPSMGNDGISSIISSGRHNSIINYPGATLRIIALDTRSFAIVNTHLDLMGGTTLIMGNVNLTDLSVGERATLRLREHTQLTVQHTRIHGLVHVEEHAHLLAREDSYLVGANFTGNGMLRVDRDKVFISDLNISGHLQIHLAGNSLRPITINTFGYSVFTANTIVHMAHVHIESTLGSATLLFDGVLQRDLTSTQFAARLMVVVNHMAIMYGHASHSNELKRGEINGKIVVTSSATLALIDTSEAETALLYKDTSNNKLDDVHTTLNLVSRVEELLKTSESTLDNSSSSSSISSTSNLTSMEQSYEFNNSINSSLLSESFSTTANNTDGTTHHINNVENNSDTDNNNKINNNTETHESKENSNLLQKSTPNSNTVYNKRCVWYVHLQEHLVLRGHMYIDGCVALHEGMAISGSVAALMEEAEATNRIAQEMCERNIHFFTNTTSSYSSSSTLLEEEHRFNTLSSYALASSPFTPESKQTLNEEELLYVQITQNRKHSELEIMTQYCDNLHHHSISSHSGLWVEHGAHVHAGTAFRHLHELIWHSGVIWIHYHVNLRARAMIGVDLNANLRLLHGAVMESKQIIVDGVVEVFKPEATQIVANIFVSSHGLLVIGKHEAHCADYLHITGKLITKTPMECVRFLSPSSLHTTRQSTIANHDSDSKQEDYAFDENDSDEKDKEFVNRKHNLAKDTNSDSVDSNVGNNNDKNYSGNSQSDDNINSSINNSSNVSSNVKTHTEFNKVRDDVWYNPKDDIYDAIRYEKNTHNYEHYNFSDLVDGDSMGMSVDGNDYWLHKHGYNGDHNGAAGGGGINGGSNNHNINGPGGVNGIDGGMNTDNTMMMMNSINQNGRNDWRDGSFHGASSLPMIEGEDGISRPRVLAQWPANVYCPYSVLAQAELNYDEFLRSWRGTEYRVYSNIPNKREMVIAAIIALLTSFMLFAVLLRLWGLTFRQWYLDFREPPPLRLTLTWYELCYNPMNYLVFIGVWFMLIQSITASMHPGLPFPLPETSRLSLYAIALTMTHLCHVKGSLIRISGITVCVFGIIIVWLYRRRMYTAHNRQHYQLFYQMVEMLRRVSGVAVMFFIAFHVPLFYLILDGVMCPTILRGLPSCKPYNTMSTFVISFAAFFISNISLPLSVAAFICPVNKVDVRPKVSWMFLAFAMEILDMSLWKILYAAPILAFANSCFFQILRLLIRVKIPITAYQNVNTFFIYIASAPLIAYLAVILHLVRIQLGWVHSCTDGEWMFKAFGIISFTFVLFAFARYIYFIRLPNESVGNAYVDTMTRSVEQIRIRIHDLNQELFVCTNASDRESILNALSRLRIEFLEKRELCHFEVYRILRSFYFGTRFNAVELFTTDSMSGSNGENGILWRLTNALSGDSHNTTSASSTTHNGSNGSSNGSYYSNASGGSNSPAGASLLTVEEMESFSCGPMLGKGSYGTVHLGILPSGRLVAVKYVNVVSENEEYLHQVKAEVNMLRDLVHPNIIRYFGVYVSTDLILVFMEFAVGGSLTSLIRKFTKLSESIMQLYTYEILCGLEYLHGKGVVHRDIKGENILIDGYGVAKLADFGCCKSLANIANPSEGGCGTLVGSPFWMAPEVIRSEVYGTKADIWSVGCTVVEMLNEGEPPWRQDFDNVYSAMFYVGSTNCIPTIPESTSELCRDFLKRCFERDVAKRATAEELLHHEWLAGVSVMRQSALDYVGSPPYLSNHTPVSAFSGKYEFPQLRGDSQVSFKLNRSPSNYSHRDLSNYGLGEENTHLHPNNASANSATTASNESTNSNSSSITNSTTTATATTNNAAISHQASTESVCEIKGEEQHTKEYEEEQESSSSSSYACTTTEKAEEADDKDVNHNDDDDAISDADSVQNTECNKADSVSNGKIAVTDNDTYCNDDTTNDKANNTSKCKADYDTSDVKKMQ